MRSTKSRISAVFAAILAVAGIAAAAWAFRSVQPAETPGNGCGAGRGLGSIAYLRAGALHVADLSTCRDRMLMRDARPPVRWSPDGRWIAFGDGRMVRANGAAARRPLGSAVASWAWSPAGDLAGVTNPGGVLVGGPGRPVRRLLPDGWGAGHVAFDPTGRFLAVDRRVQSGLRFLHQELDVIDVRTGRARVVYRPANSVVAPPELAGWSPDGGWILFWSDTFGSASLAADGLPLEAVPARGGPAVRVAGSMLPFSDFLSPCGSGEVIAAGGGRYVTRGKAVRLVTSPGAPVRRLSGDSSRSWFWPACPADGSEIAATSTANHEEHRFDAADRSIWLLSGGSATRLIGTGGDSVSDEYPQWSAGGRFLLFVRHATRTNAPAELMLARVRGRSARVVRRVATLSPSLGYYGRDDWAAVTDWHR